MAQAEIDRTAVVDTGARIGDETRVWAYAQVGTEAIIGAGCVLGNGCYIDRNAKIGDNVKVMNRAQIFRGCEVGSNVFIGPGAVIANDRYPTCATERIFDGYEWRIGDRVTIGAQAVILPDVNIGDGASIGAGSVVTHDIPAWGLVYGNPARLRGFVCACRRRLRQLRTEGPTVVMRCDSCENEMRLPAVSLAQMEVD